MKTENNTSGSNSGLGFAGLLQAAFLFCKLAGLTVIANWSWFWVLSPLWISFSLILLIMLIVGVIIFFKR